MRGEIKAAIPATRGRHGNLGVRKERPGHLRRLRGEAGWGGGKK